MKRKYFYVTGIVLSMVLSSFNYNSIKVDANNAEDNKEYIVSTVNDEIFEDVYDKYDDNISEMSEKTDNLEKHNTAVLQLSEQEAHTLEETEGVIIEPDYEVEGLGETESVVDEQSEWNMQMKTLKKVQIKLKLQ